jgi:hypothetical protein
MTDEEEFAARSQLKWTREGDAWILLYRRRRMGRVVADKDYPEMWRSTKPDGTLSDLANLSWSKDGVLAQAAREIAHERANTPSNPRKTGCLSAEIVAHAYDPSRTAGPSFSRDASANSFDNTAGDPCPTAAQRFRPVRVIIAARVDHN